MFLSTLPFFPFAQSAAPGGGLGGFIPIILLFVGMWFLLISPQRKRQKEHDKMVSELKKGDKIITTGGLFGTITFVKKDRLVVEIAEGTKVELGKQFISSKIEPEAKK
jgi:preprotein translocase subunit YajC